MNILFVKFGKKYNSGHVNDISRELKVWSNAPQFCYTDDPTGLNPEIISIAPLKPRLPGVWNKLALFSENFPIKGEFFYFDLDTVVQDNPFPYFKVTPNHIALIYNLSKKALVRPSNYDTWFNSSLMMYDNRSEAINEIWDHLVHSGQMDYFFRKYAGIDRYLLHEEMPVCEIPGVSSSAKYHAQHIRPLITYEELDFGSVRKSP